MSTSHAQKKLKATIHEIDNEGNLQLKIDDDGNPQLDLSGLFPVKKEQLDLSGPGEEEQLVWAWIDSQRPRPNVSLVSWMIDDDRYPYERREQWHTGRIVAAHSQVFPDTVVVKIDSFPKIPNPVVEEGRYRRLGQNYSDNDKISIFIDENLDQNNRPKVLRLVPRGTEKEYLGSTPPGHST